MKILFFTENFPPETNAAATRVFERAVHWVRWGHQVTVITCAPNFPEGKLFPGYRNRWRQSEQMEGIRVVRVKTYISPNKGVARRSLDFLSFLIVGLPIALVEKRPDIVVATSPQFFAAVAGWAAAALRRRPFVFELGDLWPASIAAVGAMKPSLLLRAVEKVELFLYRRSAAVAALTDSFKKNLVGRGIKADKIAVVVNGVEISLYGPRPRDANLAAAYDLKDKFVVGYVGTHGMAHGLANVLDAAEKLADLANVRFLLAGAGAERDNLIAGAERRGIANVVFMPPQPKENMPAVWSLCDVALVHLKDLPVFSGVIPSKIFEAMAMGLPLLLSAPAGEASRIIEEAGAGICVAPMDAGALADAVGQLREDQSRRAAYAKAALAAAPQHTREQQAKDMIEVFEKVAG